ncbi:MAG: type II secretion system F family protein [Candidatus Moraniibacteriota bacterium]|nr:MAG: type II secretion system F family protein [Candidatus Moranbacteria bacterium]
MKFVFKAKNEAGEEKDGLVEAVSRELAIEILQRNGLIPLSVKEEGGGMLSVVKDLKRIWEGRVAPKELMLTFRQLATLIQARVSVVTSIDTVASQVENRYFRLVLMEMKEDIEDGMSFSEALEKHPQVFDAMTVSVIRAGEVSGTLQRSITFVADNTEKNYQLTSKVRGALIYPAFVFSVAGIVGFLVMTFMLPKISALIVDLQVEVPWYTTLLMKMGAFMNSYWWVIILIFIAAIAVTAHYFRTENGHKEWDRLVLKLPVFKRLIKNVCVARFASNFGSLTQGGIPVVRGLIITSDIVGNSVYAGILLKAAEEVKTGGSISSVFFRYPNEMPAIVSQMVHIGEETGTTSEVLDGVARFYDQEVEVMTRNLAVLIEPILIVLLGIGVGILTVGVLLPIYNVAGQL